LKNYEKKSFLQIFFGYFISVTIFILLLGFLYFKQHKTFIMQKTAMNMHQYLTSLKQSDFKYKKAGYSYEIVDNAIVKKQLPQKKANIYYKAFSKIFIIKIDANIVDKEIKSLKLFTIVLQIFLTLFFAIISFLLTKKSLKPMIDTISHLDRFTKDLIHDLNTPVTSILLNTKMLKKDANDLELKKINRIENSAKNISSLYANLEVLLDEMSLEKSQIDLVPIIINVLDTYKLLYPNIDFKFNIQELLINSNSNAIKRIIDNIISNACKYSVYNNPLVEIKYQNNTLIINDNGKGIKYPKKIFERNYKESNSGYGIGMHIVHRLCDNLNINIDVKSFEGEGTTINLRFL